MVALKFILKHGKTDRDIRNLRQEIEVTTASCRDGPTPCPTLPHLLPHFLAIVLLSSALSRTGDFLVSGLPGLASTHWPTACVWPTH